MSKCRNAKIATISSNATGSAISIPLRPKTFTTVLTNGVGGNIHIETSPNGLVGWTRLTDSPLTVSAAVPADSILSEDTMVFFRFVSDSFTAGDLVDVYVSGEE